MHQRHNENMIFAILTIFEHLGPHQPLLKAPKIGFSEIYFLDLTYGLSCPSHGLEDVGPARLFFSGLCSWSSKIDRARWHHAQLFRPINLFLSKFPIFFLRAT